MVWVQVETYSERRKIWRNQEGKTIYPRLVDIKLSINNSSNQHVLRWKLMFFGCLCGLTNLVSRSQLASDKRQLRVIVPSLTTTTTSTPTSTLCNNNIIECVIEWVIARRGYGGSQPWQRRYVFVSVPVKVFKTLCRSELCNVEQGSK